MYHFNKNWILVIDLSKKKHDLSHQIQCEFIVYICSMGVI